jgi:hypothetical protein
MNLPKEFIIDMVQWHTEIKNNPETPAKVRERFAIIADFLQRRGLTTRVLLRPGQQPDDNFAIRVADLTSEGFEVIKKGYSKWVRQVADKRKDLRDLRIMEKALEDVRNS